MCQEFLAFLVHSYWQISITRLLYSITVRKLDSSTSKQLNVYTIMSITGGEYHGRGGSPVLTDPTHANSTAMQNPYTIKS